MATSSKRKQLADGTEDGPAASTLSEQTDLAHEPPSKVARLEDDRVAAPSTGVNLVEMDGKSCTHEVAWPPGQEGSLLPPPKRAGPPAREYPFKIDPFQQTAINALEAGHSVLVAAHTSAGKTVIAEYAFAMALRDKARVVYTSPLKALSNQKYREFQDEFQDVGLITGDVQINPNASCLVMTTEIYRSMLYRGSEIVREVSLVVYDEIHYLRDKERGVVWEESVILTPKSARFAFLSATIPNAKEFAEWVAKVHGSPCHVTYTDYRPTPLQHYIFPQGGDGLFMVVDHQSTFRDDNFQKAIAQLNDVDGSGGKKQKQPKTANNQANANGEPEEPGDAYKIVKMIMKKNYDPVIVFSFSKRECEDRAKEMIGLDLTDTDEKKLIESIYNNAMECLSPEDQKLPQIVNMLPMLKRGIGIHHAGLLPIVKEAVEVLFGEGLLRVLFATETFSTGLNMPAKTVVFTNTRKYDGGVSRWVTSGEYIQMSGRAGRRGLDDRGIVILMLNTRIEPAVAKDMIKGAPDTMNSAFHLKYSMILNILNVEGADPLALLQKSFKQFQAERALPKLQAKVQSLEQERDAVEVTDEEQVSTYLLLLTQLSQVNTELRTELHAPKAIVPFLNPGRLVRVLPALPNTKDPVPDFGEMGPLQPADGAGPEEAAHRGPVAAVCPGVWGAVVNFQRLGGSKDAQGQGHTGGDGEPPLPDGLEPDVEEKDKKRKKQKKRKGGDSGEPTGANRWIVDVLVNGDEDWNGTTPSISPDGHPYLRLRRAKDAGKPWVVSFPLSHIDRVSSVRVYINKDLRPEEARRQSVKVVGEAVNRLVASNGSVPLLDPKSEMQIDSKTVRKLVDKQEELESLLLKHPLATLDESELQSRLAALQKKTRLEAAVQAARRDVKDAGGVILKEELKARLRVLRRLGHITDENVLQLKGQLAAQLSTGHELVLVEMIFGGAFSALTSEQLVAVCSCMVWSERSEKKPKLREEMQRPLSALREAARRVAKVEVEAKLPNAMDPDEYAEKFQSDLMEPVAAWMRGETFKSVREYTNIFEGSLVRAMRRLEELLRQVAAALQVVGEQELAARFEKGANKLKRGVVFAASLYL